jgi:hypothetical protein
MVINMGFAEDIMQSFVSKDFQARFPAYEGWKLEKLPGNNFDTPMYKALRSYQGRKQTAILGVSFDPKPYGSCITMLESVPGDHRNKTDRYLLVPQGADVSGVPASIGLLTMKSFGFSDGELVWLTKKKNAIRYTPMGIAIA